MPSSRAEAMLARAPWRAPDGVLPPDLPPNSVARDNTSRDRGSERCLESRGNQYATGHQATARDGRRRFYFAVAAGFPLDLLPEGEGLILADRFAGEILREARPRTLCAARRKAMLIRFARASAGRLRTLLDPQP